MPVPDWRLSVCFFHVKLSMENTLLVIMIYKPSSEAKRWHLSCLPVKTFGELTPQHDLSSLAAAWLLSTDCMQHQFIVSSCLGGCLPNSQGWNVELKRNSELDS